MLGAMVPIVPMSEGWIAPRPPRPGGARCYSVDVRRRRRSGNRCWRTPATATDAFAVMPCIGTRPGGARPGMGGGRCE